MPSTNSLQFSIIVSAYNVEQYISECIDSVLAQSFQDFELILVDDGSTDRTGKICDEYLASCATNPIIQVIHQPNSGLSAARNVGIKKASGEYLIFLDGDDFLEHDALADIHQNLEPELDLLRFQAQEVFKNEEISRYPEAGFATTSGVKAFRKILHYHYIENAWLYAYRRAFFLENHFQYAEGCVAEDFGLTPLIIAKAKLIKSISDICYDYRQRSGSITHGAASIHRRTVDIERQLNRIIPEIAQIPDSAPILHYLVASFLTSATLLERNEFLRFYHQAKQNGWLRYIHPGSLRALPRAFFLKYFPHIFYKIYRRRDVAPQVDAKHN